MNNLRFVAASAAAAVGALMLAASVPTAANAAAAINLGGCALTDVSPGAAACSGFYQKNQLGGSGDMLATQLAGLTAIGWTGPLSSLDKIDFSDGTAEFFSDAANTIPILMNGTTFIGIHWGKGQGPLDKQGGGTAFYRLDLANDANLSVVNVGFGSWSGATLYKTGEYVPPCREGCTQNGVPEPATWAMMIIGFGGVGALVRRRRGLTSVA